jgi:2-polyprenyl-6-methoxyphenol hydroxylase-like FAD-dependent oxidoreductase
MQDITTDVLVVGAGPVGLSLAMNLASRGVKVTIAEIRAYAEPPNVKCNHVAARTMERFRTLGVAHKLRDAGLPEDHPNDVVFRTAMCGIELTRIPIPGRKGRYTSKEGPDTWWPTPEPPHRINQLFLEPILLEHTASLPNVTLLNRTQVTGFEQDDQGVTATLVDVQSSCRSGEGRDPVASAEGEKTLDSGLRRNDSSGGPGPRRNDSPGDSGLRRNDSPGGSGLRGDDSPGDSGHRRDDSSGESGAGGGRSVRTIRARFLVGCDGGSSTVRKAIGAKLEGTPVIQRVQSTYIRAPKLLSMLPGKKAWSYYSVNPRRCGTVFAIDGRQTWLVHNHLNPQELEFDSVERDWAIRQILGVGEDFEYEVITKEDWVGRRLVADRFRDRNVFIAGDAAHLWVPYAGYGMNAGIADALNLSWLLAARIQGWADERILDAYEAERQPITEQVSRFAMDHAAKMIKARSAVPPNIEAQDDAGARERERIGAEAYALNVEQFCCAGLNFGYFDDRSPIIAYDGEDPPAYSMGSFTESTVPGCRAPHFWLRDGRSLYDAFGKGYTLLRFDGGADVSSMTSAAATRGVPLTVLDVDADDVPAAYHHTLVLCRDDQHVAWRGDAAPGHAGRFMDLLRGA